jgi:DNA polymerase III gamma/tau subunit
MLAVVQQTVPQSKALEQFNKMGATNVTLLRIWDMLDQEFHERGVRTIKNLAEQERPASLAFCVALTSSSKRMASFLIEYAAKGGNLNLPNEKLEKEIKRLTPEAIDIIDPASGLKIEPIMFGGVMENVAEWKSRR